MIPRSACRVQLHQTTQIFTAPSLPLSLPWLAPAQLRWIASQQLLTPGDTRRTSATRKRPARTRSRKIGTIHGSEVGHGNQAIPDIFASSNHVTGEHNPKSAWNFDVTSSASTPGSNSKYIMLENDASALDRVYRMPNLSFVNGLDLLQHLYTALKVGKLDRAEAIMYRLTTKNSPTDSIVTKAHAVFLEGSAAALLQTKKQSTEAKAAYHAMQSWFDTKIQDSGVVADATIFVAMIRGALHTLDDAEWDTAIRRFLQLASATSEQVFDDVLFSEDYDDTEYDIVDHVASDVIEEEDFHQHIDPEVLPTSTEAAINMEKETLKKRKREQKIDLSRLAAVLETRSVGSGLRGVKQAMAALHELPAVGPDASLEAQKQRAIERQKLSEEAAVDIAIRRWQEADAQLKKMGINTALQTKPITALMWQWYQALLTDLEAEQQICRSLSGKSDSVDAKNTDRIHYALYLDLLPLSQVAANTIMYACSKLLNDRDPEQVAEVKITPLCDGLGRLLETESIIRNSNGHRSHGVRDKGKMRRRAHQLAAQRRNRPAQLPATADSQAGGDSRVEAEEFARWPKTVKLKLGAMLIQKLVETAQLPVTREHPRTKERVTQLQPAFLSRTRYQRGIRAGVLCPNSALLSKLQSEPVGSLIAKRMPMIVEPRPWKGFADGGYLHYPTEVMRIVSAHDGCKDHLVAADKRGDLNQVYSGLNALGKVPWRVNHDVFKTQLEAWNSGEAVANFAPLHPKLEKIPEPDQAAGLDARRQWLLDIRDQENKRSGFHSQRCFQNFQLEIARAMVNETMYFPHNLDFRGRAYPIPPYLNHMGADNVRALLVFAEGKELGTEGLRWLKIHVANVAGYDKASLQEREDFTMAHLADIRDSTRDPLGGKRWWLKSEDAWQTLAACFELVNALDSPDPTKFVSHLPIHQDGTCNGLQHYAALGGDKAGAAHVNLEPGDRPADVYSAVATGVAEAVARDAAAGHPVAKVLDGHITRRVVKQPVMTNVYGVTHYGARAQVRKQLEVLFPDVHRTADVNHSMMAAYIASKIFEMLGTLFTGAQAIQRWLEISAHRISTCLLPEQIDELLTKGAVERNTVKSKRGRPRRSQVPVLSTSRKQDSLKPLFKSTVVWTTPLRLPVVQPYRAASARQVQTSMQRMAIQEPRMWDPVHRKKQLQAFPPNFIHSLDATHMLISANKCDEIGLTFASIHDSFWTHACDITTMSSVLRDAFITMHSEDVIGRLREEFQTRYRDCMYLASVTASSPIGKKISLWRREHARTMKIRGSLDELALEVERMRLLRSEDAEERIKGAQMVTPGSILEAHDDEAIDAPAMKHASSRLPLAAQEDLEIKADEDELAAQGETASDHSSTPYLNKAHVWCPMRFPSVPEKGDFDVSRLRQSKYFFH